MRVQGALRGRTAPKGAEWCSLAAVTMGGLVCRLPGFSSHGLFFDDAWPATAAMVSTRTALHLVATDPGFGLAERLWLHLVHAGTATSFTIALVPGVLAIVLAWALGWCLQFGPLGRTALAASVAFAPEAIALSVRLKEYETDLCLALIVLAAAELVRQRPTTRRFALLGLLSTSSLVWSLLLAPVVVGAWLGLVLVASSRQVGRRTGWWWSAPVGVVLAAVGWWSRRNAPPALVALWRSGNHLGDPLHQPGQLAKTVVLAVAGTIHGFTGLTMPAPHPYPTHLAAGSMRWLVAETVVVAAVAVVVLGLAAKGLRRSSADGRLVIPAVVLVVAGVSCIVGLVPLGTGRTELVVLPAGAVLTLDLARRALASPLRGGRRRAILVGIVALLAVAVGWRDRSWYPEQSVGEVLAQVASSMHAPTAIVLVRANTFTYAAQGLGPVTVHVDARNPLGGAQGVWIVPRSQDVVAEHALVHGQRLTPPLSSIGPAVDRLVIVGTTVSASSPSDFHVRGPSGQVAIVGTVQQLVEAAGWRQTGWWAFAPGVYAEGYRRGAPRAGVRPRG